MNLRLHIFILLAGLLSCIDRVEPTTNYESVDRVIGPEGGTVSFFEDGLPGESGLSGRNTIPVATLEIPEGAISSEVTFKIRKRALLTNKTFLESWEITPANLQFNKPVKLTMTYGLTQEEYTSLDNGCFYKPYRIALDSKLSQAINDVSLWEEVPEYDLNDLELSYTTTIAALDHIYLFYEGLNEPEYTFCVESNEYIDINLGGDHNVLTLTPGSMPTGSYLNIIDLALPEQLDYPQPVIGDYVVLASSGGYLNIESNISEFQDSAALFFQANAEQAGEVWLDWNYAADKVKFLRLDPENNTVLEALSPSPELSVANKLLFGRMIKEIGAYVIAVHKDDFKLRFGGRIHVTISGGTTYDEVIENYDYGGAFIDLFYARYDLNINPGKDETAGYFLMTIGPIGDDFSTREFPSSSSDSFLFRYYDEMDTERWIRLRSFSGLLSYSLVDPVGGWIEGELTTKDAQSAYNESGADVEFTINFRFRIAQWFEL